MNTYTDINTTPLKFHRFFWKIWIPIQIILGGYNLGMTVAEMPALDIYYGIDIAYFMLSGILFAAAFGGFFRFKRSALVSLFMQMAINIIYVLVLFFIYTKFMPDSVNLAFGSIVGTFIRCVPVGIYYYKRRNLFVKGGYSKEQMQQINGGIPQSFSGSFANSSSYTYSNAQGENSNAQAHFCHNCGKQLQNNPNFCIYCGTKLK